MNDWDELKMPHQCHNCFTLSPLDTLCGRQCPLYQYCDEVRGWCSWDLAFQDARFCDNGKLELLIIHNCDQSKVSFVFRHLRTVWENKNWSLVKLKLCLSLTNFSQLHKESSNLDLLCRVQYLPRDDVDYNFALKDYTILVKRCHALVKTVLSPVASVYGEVL